MFPNVLMTTLAAMRDTDKVQCYNNRQLTTVWPEAQQEKLKDTNIKKTIKKKKRNRTMFTTEQVRVLEKVFARSRYIDVERRKEISDCLQIEQKCIKIWFQNRRMKEKKELSDSCDSTSESHLSSVESPPLESRQHSKSESDIAYSHMYSHQTPSQYYYDDPNKYIKTEVYQNGPSNYESSNNLAIPQYFGYNNNYSQSVFINERDYSTHVYPPQTGPQHYYNSGEINSQYVIGNVPDWPANIYDTSYF